MRSRLTSHELRVGSYAGGAKLLVVDPIVAAIISSLDAYKDQHVRFRARPARRNSPRDGLRRRVRRPPEQGPCRDAYIRVANTVAFWNACSWVVLITEDDGEPTLRLVAQRKAN